MNNKKLFASALALSMFFGLTACSSEKPEDTKVVDKNKIFYEEAAGRKASFEISESDRTRDGKRRQ